MEKLIVAQISIKESNVTQFLELAATMVKNSNAEKGCLTYRLFNEINKPNEFVFYEKYVNQDAITVHNTSTHFKTFISSITPLLAKEPVIEIY